MGSLFGLLLGTGDDVVRKVNVVYSVQLVKGVALGMWSRQAALADINGRLTDDGRGELDAVEISELETVCDHLTGLPDITSKLVYLAKVEALFFAAEIDAVTESKFKAELGIG